MKKIITEIILTFWTHGVWHILVTWWIVDYGFEEKNLQIPNLFCCYFLFFEVHWQGRVGSQRVSGLACCPKVVWMVVHFISFFCLQQLELNQAWIFALFLSIKTWFDKAWLLPIATSRHLWCRATLPPPATTKGFIRPLWPLFQSLSSNESGQLMEDYLLDCKVTCLCSYLRFPPLHYISGLVSHLSSVIIRTISATPHTHVQQLPRRTAAKTFEWKTRNSKKERKVWTTGWRSTLHRGCWGCHIQLHQQGDHRCALLQRGYE